MICHEHVFVFYIDVIYNLHLGAVFANVFLIEAVTELCSNSLFFPIYANTQSFMKGFVFLVFAMFSVVFIVVMM